MLTPTIRPATEADLPRIIELRLLPDRFTPGPPVKVDAAKYRHGIVCKIGD